MMDKHLSEKHKVIRKQAAAYAVHLFSGDLSEQESEAILKWSNTSSLHQSELEEMIKIYSASGQLYESAKPVRGTHLWLKGLAIAASIIAFSLWTVPAPEEQITETNETSTIQLAVHENKNRYQTDVGEITKVVLSDNTVITLNTDTNIEVNYSKEQRYVRLLHGEAFFEVAKDASRPFKIDTGIRMVEVIGTKFNLRKLNSELVVAVSEGLVSVQHHPEAGSKKSLDDNLSVKELMPAGSIATFSETRKIVTKTSDEKVNSMQNWRSGVLSFDDVSLDEFVSELNRYQKIKIVVADTELNKLRISGVFNPREADAALEALEEILPIRFERHADNINIVKKL